MTTGLDYDNRTGRPAGITWRTLGAIVPGIGRVRAQVDPYADAWTASNREALARGAPRWVVLGDSMAQGVGATTHLDGLVGQLDRRLRAAGHDLAVVNLSATGARVADVLEQQLPLLESLGKPAPALVTAIVGSNDLFSGGANRRALPERMGRLVVALPDGSIIATLPQPQASAQQANGHIERAVAAGRLRMVDMRTAGPASWRGLVAADRFHPNDVGYTAIADAFWPVICRAVAK